MAQTYWINRANGKFYLHFKVDQPAGSQVTWTVTKKSGYAPELPQDFFDFWDSFDGTTLDTTKWVNNYTGSISVSDSKLNLWNDGGACCDSHCYYSSIDTVQTFDLPVQILVAGNQDPYEASTNCGRTGLYVIYKDSLQYVISTDTDSDASSYRIGTSYAYVPNSTPMPNVAPENFMYIVNFHSQGIQIRNTWFSDADLIGTPTYTTGQPIGIGGDTDSTTIVDHFDYIAIYPGREKLPSVSIIEQGSDYLKILVDDSTTGVSTDLTNFIVTIALPDGFVANEGESLEILNKSVYILIENPNDNQVYYWDSANSQWVSLNKTKDQLLDTDFIMYGTLAPLFISKADMDILTNTPNILYFVPTTATNVDATIRFFPKKRLVVQRVPFNLNDFTVLNRFYHTWSFNNWSSGGPGFTTILSRDGENWYVWDTTNSQWKFLETRTLDPLSQTDIDWVYANGVGLGTYGNLTSSEWNDFFNQGLPDYIYMAIVHAYYDIDDDLKLSAIYAEANTKEYWLDDSANHEIRFTENNISVKFNAGGTYKINYLD